MAVEVRQAGVSTVKFFFFWLKGHSRHISGHAVTPFRVLSGWLGVSGGPHTLSVSLPLPGQLLLVWLVVGGGGGHGNDLYDQLQLPVFVARYACN